MKTQLEEERHQAKEREWELQQAIEEIYSKLRSVPIDYDVPLEKLSKIKHVIQGLEEKVELLGLHIKPTIPPEEIERWEKEHTASKSLENT